MERRNMRFLPFALTFMTAAPWHLHVRPAFAGPPADKAPERPSAQAAPAGTGQQPTSNNEDDLRKRRGYQRSRAAVVELRNQGYQLAQLGRQTKDPLPLILAARIFQNQPTPRPLVSAGAVQGQPCGAVPVQRKLATVRDAPEPSDLLAEAQSLIATNAVGPLRDSLQTLLQQVKLEPVSFRGAMQGPQQVCDRLLPNARIIYHVLYEGGEQAVVGITGGGDLHVSVVDENNLHIAHAADRSLISWYPRWRGSFQILIENSTTREQSFCLETN